MSRLRRVGDQSRSFGERLKWTGEKVEGVEKGKRPAFKTRDRIHEKDVHWKRLRKRKSRGLPSAKP